jgi:LysM repeat protein
MKWRHWSILIILVLLNYVIFSTAFTLLAKQRDPGPQPARTPQPTFETIEPGPVAWKVLPTSTRRPTRIPVTITTTPTPTITPSPEITATAQLTPTLEGPATESPTVATGTPAASDTPMTPTASPVVEGIVHTIRRGETLSEIAVQYGVTVKEIVEANGLTNPSRIITGQKLIIPVPAEATPTATQSTQPTNTPRPTPTATQSTQPTNTPRPTSTQAPPPTATPRPATPTPTPAGGGFQFTGEVIWNPMVAPNCGGPAIAKDSIIRDAGGNPVNGVRIEVDCYGNKFVSRPSGTPGEYDAGHYDFALGQNHPQDWTCTARVLDLDGEPVASSETVTITFDTNDCEPGGSGHQVAIVNWTKHW